MIAMPHFKIYNEQTEKERKSHAKFLPGVCAVSGGDTLDFSSGRNVWGNYSGSERKRRLILDGVVYMLKYPDPVRDAAVLCSTFIISFPNMQAATSASPSAFLLRKPIWAHVCRMEQN